MKKLICLLLLTAAAVLLAMPSCRYGVLGLVRGESFYQGRPTSYWRGVVKDWTVPRPCSPQGPPPTTLLHKVRAFLVEPFAEKVVIPPGEDQPDALPVLIELLSDEDAAVRSYAVTTIEGIGPSAKAAVPRLILLLEDEDPEVRALAAFAVDTIHGRAEFLLRLIEDRDPATRHLVALALSRVNEPREVVISGLKKLLSDPDEKVRDAAAESLEALTKKDS